MNQIEQIRKYAEEIHDLLVQVGVKASEIRLLAQDQTIKDVDEIWWIGAIINNAVNAADDANWVLKRLIWKREIEE